ncbi:YlxR family protein [Aquipuribacter sp. SD81]|uniref:YlxR family protein n=1 Tax=Aquipuribacter sp. SD81 TaxID=3127703 RepID=UPI003018A3E8
MSAAGRSGAQPGAPRSAPAPDGATLTEASTGAAPALPERTEPRYATDTTTADGPVRTCIGCRRPGSRSVLARFVVVEVEGRPQVVHDPGRRSPGRGAWLHPDPTCAEHAVRRKAFARALRTAGPVATDQVAKLARTWATGRTSTTPDVGTHGR